ncbi:MAG TPA: HNH endonuclease signature motif containing protein, partial [Longimicrobiales bacterium]
RFTDAHHIRHWADGGPTRLDNLVLLCRFHHRKVHEDGFGVALVDGRATFRDPRGRALSAVGPI